MRGKKVAFNTRETEDKAPVKRAGHRKLDMNKIIKNALGSIPARISVDGSLEQRAEANLMKMAQGCIPAVAGSLMKADLNQSGEKIMGIKDLNYVAYHDTTGVRTGAKAASKGGNKLFSDIREAERNGWVKTEIGWMYKENGNMVTGWKQIDGKWYYFETNQLMQTGWKQIGDKWYYLHTDGAMRTGWKLIDGKWYYLRSNGEMAMSEWRQDGAGKWYYVRSNGEIAISQMRKGTDGNSYYLGEDGAMVVNKDITWEGNVYQVNGNGVCSRKSNGTGHNVSDIHPKLRMLQKKLIEECKNQGLLVRITQEIRTVEEQDRLYSQGRTVSGNIVTNAKGSDYSSHHQWGTAFDFCRNDGKDPYYDEDRFFDKVGEIGKSIGLEWGGDWKSPVDKPHFQLPDWGSTTKVLKQKYGTPDEFEKTWYQ